MTGATPPRKDDLMKIWESNFTKEQNNRIHHYYFRGGFDYSKLSKKHKVLMSLMKIKLKNQKKRLLLLSLTKLTKRLSP